MSLIWRAARTIRLGRTIASAKIPSSALSLSACTSLSNGTLEQHRVNASEGVRPKFLEGLSVHAVLAGLLGYGMLDVAFADSNEAATGIPHRPKSSEIPTPPEPTPASSQHNLQEIARREKARLEELLTKNGAKLGFYPRITVSVKGQKVTVKFQVPPSCEVPLLISKLVSRLGVKAKDSAVGSDMILRVWDSGVSWQLTLSRPKTQNEINDDHVQGQDNGANDGDFCVIMFRPLISSEKAEIEFMKQGSYTTEELEALASILQFAGKTSMELRPRADTTKSLNVEKAISSLEGMGVKVYGLKHSNGELSNADISWDNIAGYDHQKREIEDTILLALKSPEVYDDIARGTRCKFETNRPRAVLFEGPPETKSQVAMQMPCSGLNQATNYKVNLVSGTGKTSCARVIATQAGVPLLYVPLEIIMSKYYGESERLLGKVFSLANEIPNGAIIFLDEVDSVATARDSETHEASRRLLSVLLGQIDGFEQDRKVIVIAATNRKQDLDPALHSRFDSIITFGLPDQPTREAIVGQYAKHLSKSEMAEVASVTAELSGRDIKDVCQQAERRWASKIIRGQAQKIGEESSLPPLSEYIESAMQRGQAMAAAASAYERRQMNPFSKKSHFDFM